MEASVSVWDVGSQWGWRGDIECVHEGQGIDLIGITQYGFSEPEHRYSEPKNRRRAKEGMRHCLHIVEWVK